MSLTGPRYASDAQIRGYAAALLEQTRAPTPGVRDAAIASSTPLNSGPHGVLRRAWPAAARAQRRAEGDSAQREPGVLPHARHPVRRPGATLRADDADGAPRVAIVNQTLASRLFPGEDPVGRVIELIPGARAAWTRRPGR